MIWLWNNTSWPMRKISRELNKAARLDCSKWPNQKVDKTECFLTQVMLWNCTSRCIIKSLTWGSHSFPASTSWARKSKVRISTSEGCSNKWWREQRFQWWWLPTEGKFCFPNPKQTADALDRKRTDLEELKTSLHRYSYLCRTNLQSWWLFSAQPK